MSFTKTLFCASSTLALLAAGGAQSQAQETANEIVVTGTSIRGVAPVGAAVMKMSQEEIKDTGLTSNVDLLRKLPQVVNIGADEARVNSGANTATANTYRASGINIRGLGTQATLTLVDGQRPAPAGLQASFFDPSTIPTIALSGMEVVPDGASAIYGADAISGVANLILRKNFDGFEARVGVTRGDGYKADQYSAIGGKTWSGGSAMLAADYSWRPPFAASERPDLFIGAGSGATRVAATATLPQYQTLNSFPTTLTAGGVTYAVNAGGVTPITTAAVLPGANQRNVLNTWEGVNLVGSQKRMTLIGNVSQDFGAFTVYGQGYGSRREFGHFTSAATTANLTVRNTNPYAAFLTGLPGAPTQGTVAYSFINSIGPGNFRGYEDQGQAVLGVKFTPFGDFQVDLSAAQNYSHNDRLIDNINNCALTGTASNVSGPCTLTGGAIGQTSLATAFNPFGVTPQAVVDQIKSWTIQRFQVQLREIKAKIDGTLTTIPGGDVKIAVGADYIHQKNWFNNYTTSTTANNSIRRQTSGNTKMQDITAAFVEVVVPVIGSENQTAWAKSLQLSAAGRVDWYSIYDDPTKNPKLGITYAPTDDLTFRSSYSTSFRTGLKDIDPNNAPNVTSRITQYFDYTCNCNVTSLNRQGGNPLVKPELSRTLTLGANFQPSRLPGLDLDVTYFKIAYNNIIDMPGNNVNTGVTSAAQEALYGAYLTRRPAASDVAGTATFNALVTSLLNSPYYTSAQSPAVNTVQIVTSGQSWNAGSLRTQGLDFSAFYDKATSIGDLTIGMVGTYYLKFDRSLTPTDTLSDKLNTIDNPTTYRLRGQLGWKKGGFSANAFVNYTPEYDNTNVTPIAKVDSYTIIDANVAYEHQSENKLFNGLRLGVSAQNLFDTDPPYALVAGVQNYDSQVASPYGRLVSVQLSKSF